MILDQCPHCRAHHVQATPVFSQNLDNRDGTILWSIARCQNNECQRLVLVQITNTGQIQQIFPFASYQLDAKAGVPAPIAEDFREAGLCLGAG